MAEPNPMARKYLLPILAAIGLAIAIVAVIQGNQAQSVAPPGDRSPEPPFASYVVGTGLTEASTGNIAIGTPVSGIVSAIDVTWGQKVAVGTPLFKIDDRDIEAQLLSAEAMRKQAGAEVAKAEYLLKAGQGLNIGSSISAVDLANRRFDVEIKQAALDNAAAQVKRLKIEIERHIVRAPVAGRVLQINMRVGEFAQSGVVNPPLMRFGDDSRLYLRVNVDENDAWRVHADAAAVAFVRGNPSLKTPVKFVRFEPYVLPKASLTGSSTERTDMRVLQVIYSFDHAALPVYVGQQMDAYIEAPPAGNDVAGAQK
jgi:HlyD family secretion protein